MERGRASASQSFKFMKKLKFQDMKLLDIVKRLANGEFFPLKSYGARKETLEV